MPHSHSGNVLNQILIEEHDSDLYAKKISLVAGATVYQGTNPWINSLPSGATIFQGTDPWSTTIKGNITLSDSKGFIGLVSLAQPLNANVSLNASANYIGLATVMPALAWPDPKSFIGLTTITGNIGILGNVTLSDPKGYIGLVSIAQPINANVSLSASANYIGLASINIGGGNVGINGNVTLTDSKTFIGLTTTTLGASPAFIGIATIANQPALVAGAAYVGLATVDIGTIKAWSNPNTFIGLVTVDIGTSKAITWAGNVTLSDAKTYIGLATSTLGVGSTFIGLVTAVTQNAGTNKTLIPMNLSFATASVATIAVPTGGNAIFKVTNLVLNSNATVRLNIKSGVTYLTGNASLGINIFPGGGWVQDGVPDSPTYVGLASGAAIVLEKFDSGGIISQIGGHLLYFQE